MPNEPDSPLSAESRLRRVFNYDNQIVSLILLALACQSWFRLWILYVDLQDYMFQGLRVVPIVGLAATFFSSIYLTIAAAISWFSRQPRARYRSVLPNILSLFAAFFVYCFALLPLSDSSIAPVWLSLALILAGNTLVLIAFAFLRRAFTVTPQVRNMVRSGPYALVRHPMYLGNILVLLGISLMVGSTTSMIIFVVAAGLQVIRAISEERLMLKWIPNYHQYCDQVGFFLPITRALKVIFIIALIANGFIAGASYAQEIVASSSSLNKADAVKDLCSRWNAKIVTGAWVTAREGRQFSNVWAGINSKVDADSIPVCHDLFELADSCQNLAVWWGNDDDGAISSPAILDGLDQISNKTGCRSIVGLDELCKAVRILSKRRLKLTDNWSSLISECLDSTLRKSTGTFMRAGL